MADDEKTLEQIEAENAAKKEGLALDEKRLKTVQKILAAQKVLAEQEEEKQAKRAAAEQKSLDVRTQLQKKDREELAAMKEKAAKAVSFEKRMELQEEYANRAIENLERQVALDRDRLKAAKESGTASEEKLADLEETLKKNSASLKLNRKNLDEGKKAIAQGKTILKNLGSQALGQNKVSKAITGGVKGLHSMWNMAKGLKAALDAGAISAAALTAALGIGIILLVVGAVAKLVEWTIGLAVKTRDATVAFQRATGATQEFGAAIPALERDMRAVGVSMDEASAAQMALYTSTTDYTMASAAARKDLLKTTALMGEFGVSVETSSKIAQAATKGLGMGIGEADELLLGLSAHAQDIGVPISKMMDDFAASADELKRFGSDGERVFKRLAMVSKVTGMEIGRILAITEKFDTFEGAAKQAGMLNAAIGGNMVNAMDLMMTTDPVERFSMIKDSIMDTVGSFDDMSYYQKKFYANAAGLKDVGELAAMMSGDFDTLDGNIGKTSKDFAEQRKQAQRWQSTMEILKNTLAAFAPTMSKLAAKLQPVLDKFADGEGPLKDFGDSVGKVMEDALIPLLDSLGKDPSPITKFFDYIGTLPEKMDAIVTFFRYFSAVLIGIGAALVVASLPITGIWAAIAAGIAGLIAGVTWFMNVVSKRRSPSFLDMFTGDALTKGMKAVSKAIEFLAKPIKFISGLFGKLGQIITDTFDFSNVKELVTGGLDFVTGLFGDSVDGIKTEMEISSPSKKMEREIMDPTFVQPMKSVAAKMPGLVDEVYGDVPAMAAKNLKPLTGAGGAPAAMNMDQMASELAKGNITKVMAEITNQNKAALAALTQGNAGAGPQTTQVSIPITIGKEQLGTVVTEIVDGRLGAVSWQGMASTGI